MNYLGRCEASMSLKNPYVKLTCVNMLVFGIELTISAGFSYLPPMLLKAGFGEVAMTWIMGVGPFFALLTVPFLGSWSDGCKSKWGRRTPFMLGISLALIISLLFISFGHLVPSFNIFLLVTGAVILNYSCQVCLNPCEAVVADMTAHSVHQELGFTIYSIMISLGGCAGYLITAFDWSDTSFQWLFKSAERTAFAFVLVMLVITLFVTIYVVLQKPLRKKRSSVVESSIKEPPLLFDDVGYESAGNDSLEDSPITVVPQVTPSPTTFERPTTSRLYQAATRFHPKKIFRILYCQVFHQLHLYLSCANCLWKAPTKFVKNCAIGCHKLIHIPPVLRLLFVADLLSWTALMCQLMFYTDYVGQAVYGGNPNSEDDSEKRKLYDAGVRMGSFGLLLHGIFSIIYACTIQKYLLRTYGCRMVYFVGLLVYTFSMLFTLVTNNLIIINLMATLSGTGFAAITTVPYMLISAYHSQPQLYFSENLRAKDLVVMATVGDIERSLEAEESSEDASGGEEEESNAHSRGFGADIAVIDSAYFLSQTVLSLFIGSLVDMTHSVTAYIAIAALFGAFSCYSTTRVIFPPHV